MYASVAKRIRDGGPLRVLAMMAESDGSGRAATRGRLDTGTLA